MAKQMSTKTYGLIIKLNVVAVLLVFILWGISVFLEDGTIKWILYIMIMPFGLYIIFASGLMLITQIQYKKIEKKKEKSQRAVEDDKPID